MNKISINLLTNILLLLVGIILIIFHARPDLLIWVTRAIGLMFLLPGIYYLVAFALRRESTGFSGILPAIGGVCFGIVLMARPALFTTAMGMMMGVMMLVLGLYHLVYIVMSRKMLKFTISLILLPMLIIACSAAVLLVDRVRANPEIIVLLTGLSLFFFCLTTLLEYHAERRQATLKSEREAQMAAGTGNNAAEHNDPGPCHDCDNDNNNQLHVEL